MDDVPRFDMGIDMEIDVGIDTGMERRQACA
jgi:hypothetical protein